MKLYHVTFERNLPSIAKRGLVPGSPAVMGAFVPGEHLEGAIFLTSADGLFYWYTNAEEATVLEEPRWETGYTPVVLRTPEPIGCAYDEVGTFDADAPAFRCETKISPTKLEVWDGEQWLPVKKYKQMDTSIAYEEDDYFSADYPLMPEWRDLYKNNPQDTPVFDPCFDQAKIEPWVHLIPKVYQEIRRYNDPGPFPSRIECMTEEEIEVMRQVGSGHGLYIADEQRIKLNPNMSANTIFQYFIHENLHHALRDTCEPEVDVLTESVAHRVLSVEHPDQDLRRLKTKLLR